MTDYTQIEFAIPEKASIVEVVVGEAFAGVFTYFLCEGMKVDSGYVVVRDKSSVDALYACAMKSLKGWNLIEMHNHSLKERGVVYVYKRIVSEMPSIKIDDKADKAALYIKGEYALLWTGCAGWSNVNEFYVDNVELVEGFVENAKKALLGWELVKTDPWVLGSIQRYQREVVEIAAPAPVAPRKQRRWTKEELDDAEDMGMGHHDMDGFVWYSDARPARRN